MQAVVQLRGEVNISEDVRDTLAMLNLGRVNHCTLLPETDAYRGMITKVHDYVAHGEPSADTVATGGQIGNHTTEEMDSLLTAMR